MTTAAPAEESPFRRFVAEFAASKVAVFGLVVFVLIALSAIFANWIGPQNPYDLAQLDIMDGRLAPGAKSASGYTYLLGTDDQGRDMFSGMLYGLRISLAVGVGSAIFAACVGTTLGLLAAFFGRRVDAIVMRVVDLQLSFPSILIALLVDGIARAVLPRELHNSLELYVLIFAIGISGWPQFARTVRGSTMVERNKEYVMAARVIGIGSARIMFSHILPNVLGPVLVIATLSLGQAILAEATLSFLGVGLPPTEPSLGTLIRIGQNFLLSGEWWVTIFPGIALALMVLAINLLGDWLRDALNPRLR